MCGICIGMIGRSLTVQPMTGKVMSALSANTQDGAQLGKSTWWLLGEFFLVAFI